MQLRDERGELEATFQTSGEWKELKGGNWSTEKELDLIVSSAAHTLAIDKTS